MVPYNRFVNWIMPCHFHNPFRVFCLNTTILFISFLLLKCALHLYHHHHHHNVPKLFAILHLLRRHSVVMLFSDVIFEQYYSKIRILFEYQLFEQHFWENFQVFEYLGIRILELNYSNTIRIIRIVSKYHQYIIKYYKVSNSCLYSDN